MAVIQSCSKDDKTDFYNVYNLPLDEGGEQTAVIAETTDSPYGYYVYKPSYYEDLADVVFPTLIFLHGSGERGNSANGATQLNKVLSNGPGKLIKREEWNPPHPMLVFSPQTSDNWSAGNLKEFVEYIIENYKVNVQRIYLTGLSLGGYGTFSYIGTYGEASYISACIPICGGGNTRQAGNFKSIPTWVFHGDADNLVPVNNSINMVEAINDSLPDILAKLTIYPGVGHDSWTKTYNGEGMGTESDEYDPFNQSVYDWLFQYYRTDLDTLIGCGCN